MKKALCMLTSLAIFFCLLPATALAAEDDVTLDEVHFPDANFRTALMEIVDVDHNGILSQAELDATTDLNLSQKQISDLTGISYFQDLVKLSCNSNHLTSLDLSCASHLEYLDCSNNPLTTLDISNNPELRRLDIGGYEHPVLDLNDVSVTNPILETICYSIADSRELRLSTISGLNPAQITTLQGGRVDPDTIYIDGSYLSDSQDPLIEFTWQPHGKAIPIDFRITSTLKYTSGWVHEESGWKYNNGDGTFPHNEWKQIDGSWYYFNAEGYRQTGWLEIDDQRFYLNEDGQRLTGWQYIDDSWFYMNESGQMQTGWVWTDGAYSYFDGFGHMLTGWQYIDGFWYFIDSHGYMQTGWVWTDGTYSYFNGSGHMLTGWQYIDGFWYFIDSHGYMQTGWVWTDGTYSYFNGSGHMLTGWQYIDGFWYFIDSHGYMQTGWVWTDGAYSYFNGSGHMLTGWQYIDGFWYFIDSHGYMQTGWVWTDGTYSYFNGSGHMLTGWQYIDGFWYFIDSHGYMQTGWVWTDGTYSYFNGSGHMLTGWQYIDGFWYFIDSHGYMQTGWHEIDGQHYYFNGSGHMLRNTWVDNCYLGSNGAWVTADIPSGSKRFYVAVNCQENTVTIYERDSHGYYTIPYKAMVCSSGLSHSPTPKGTFRPTGNRWKWLRMVGDVWGMYVTQIRGNYLFHSVPYTEFGNHGSLQEGEFDKLGEDASHGCIRLQIKDSKWIYDHMKDIDQIDIFDSSDPGPLGKPSAPKIGDSAYPGWDPTDTDPDNPWLNAPAPAAYTQ